MPHGAIKSVGIVVAFFRCIFFMICMFISLQPNGKAHLRRSRQVQRLVICFHYNSSLEISKNRSKKFLSLKRTLSLFFVRSPVFEKRDTGGKTLVIAVPVLETLPSRNAFFTTVSLSGRRMEATASVKNRDRCPNSYFRNRTHSRSDLNGLVRF